MEVEVGADGPANAPPSGAAAAAPPAGAREFNMLLCAWLVDHGWRQCVSDPCIYIFRAGHVLAMIALYLDDIPAGCNDATWLTSFKAQLGARFKIKDMGDLSQLMGMHITRDRSARTISLD
jgi:hypothetical protein